MTEISADALILRSFRARCLAHSKPVNPPPTTTTEVIVTSARFFPDRNSSSLWADRVTCRLRSYLIAPLWPHRTFTVSLAQKVQVVQVLPVAAGISDHHLCVWGELSSSGCAFHPGEADQEQKAGQTSGSLRPAANHNQDQPPNPP